MVPSEEQPPELLTPPAGGESVRLEAHAWGEASTINQAARDLHLHYQNGVRGRRHVEPGTQAGECPYPGLASFGREQARWFFGRDQLASKLIARLDNRLWSGGVQVVVAPSGAGKSSLLHAGLLPKLDNGALPGSSRWPRIVFTPTADPLAALASHIAALIDTDSAELAEKLAAHAPSAGAVLRQLLLNRLGGEDPEARLVVVVDQFEELFTLCTDDQQRRTFIEVLSQLTSPPLSTETDRHILGLVVVGVRADFYTACANDTHLRTALEDNPLLVGPMSDTELREAILYPAQDVGLDVEPGLVELLLRDLGDTTPTTGEGGVTGYEAGRLPLLAHALRATWQQRHGYTLTVEGYRNTGGIHCAVATTAESVFTSLDAVAQHTARTLFLRLVTIGDGTEDTRRRVARTDLLRGLNPGGVGPVVDAFTQGRLLTQEQDTVEITHEALLRAWPRLRQWIDTDRVGNLICQELDAAADVWDREGRDTAGLYRGSRLEAARTWAASTAHEDDVSPAASAFLAASTQQEHRTARLRRTMLVVLSVLALVASGAAVVALHLSAAAQRERDTAIFNQLTARADRLRGTDVSLAAQLDFTAYRMRPTQDLYTALVTLGNAALSTSLAGHTDRVTTVAFSPDGRTLATGSDDHTLRLWNMTNPARPTSLGAPLTGHTDHVRSVVFSPDGRTLASGGADRMVRLWNVADPAHPTPLGPPLTGHTDEVTTVVFSPDGRTLATGGHDQTVRLWNTTNPAHPIPLGPPLAGHTPWINSVVFSPDGRTLASGDTNTVRLWNVTDPAHPTPLGPPLTGHTDDINGMVFSRDGHILASGGGDQTVRLWNVTDPAHPTSLGPPLMR
jgi:WD40 repeat protein